MADARPNRLRRSRFAALSAQLLRDTELSTLRWNDNIKLMNEGNVISNCELFRPPPLGPGELAAIERIGELRKDLRFFVAEPRRWLGPVRKILSAKAIQGTNSIEGYDVSDDEAVAAVAGDEPHGDSPQQSVKALLAYQRAMTYVLQLAKDEHFHYEPALIRSLHFMMTEYDSDASPGLWRPGPIWIRNDETREIVYEGPDPESVPHMVACLMQEIEQMGDDYPAMVKAAMAHLNLVMIHPFRDGNGRMSRCLQTLVLAREGILSPEFCSIEEYLGRNTQSYYDVLSAAGRGSWNPENDTTEWVRYCLTAHYVQAASVLRRVRESETTWGLLEEAVERTKLPTRTIEALFDATFGLKVRNASYRTAVQSASPDYEISNQTATKDLNRMVQAGLLTKKGTKRGSYYVAARSLVDIRSAHRDQREKITFDHLFDIDETEQQELAT